MNKYFLKQSLLDMLLEEGNLAAEGLRCDAGSKTGVADGIVVTLKGALLRMAPSTHINTWGSFHMKGAFSFCHPHVLL